MAIIATTYNQATVRGQGEARTATVNFSGALMEMLATVYTFILMAAVRESIQNACDAARRKGLSFADGVLVELPTPENPVFRVTDQGAGMTREFMENEYMSFGTSTKAGDNGAAGGLGVGRWAAYGYIREAYITTTHEDEMVERTFFQYQGENAIPRVQLASETPGTVPGTKVFFPVKESDIGEVYLAVAWLKDVMQLTMGDSFSVDKPALLPKALPKFSGTRLELGEIDENLAGIVVYPMQGPALHYGRAGLTSGSLVVLTNKAQGVGGLPFHVRETEVESVLHMGSIVEIPMSFNIPFMPSREEIKYTDEVTTLLKRIHRAAMELAVKKAAELYSQPSMLAKESLSSLLGTSEVWNAFTHAARNGGSYQEAMKKATGGREWRGKLHLNFVEEVSYSTGVSLRYMNGGTLSMAHCVRGGLVAVSDRKLNSVAVQFTAVQPLTLVVNDIKSGGIARMRHWYLGNKGEYLFISGDNPGDAQKAADAFNRQYGGGLEMLFTSKMPEPPKVIVGKKLVRRSATAGQLTYLCCSKNKQEVETTSFDTPAPKGVKYRVWVEKDGGQVKGLKASTQVKDLQSNYDSHLGKLLATKGVDKLYLLTPRQAKDLRQALADAQEDGLFDMDADEFGDDADSVATREAVRALKQWIPLEQTFVEAVQSTPVQETLAGKRPVAVVECYDLRHLCDGLAKAPRMVLTGTKFDKAISSYVDLVAGVSKYLQGTYVQNKHSELCKALKDLAAHFDVTSKDVTQELKDSVEQALKVVQVGTVDHESAWKSLKERYPLLSGLKHLTAMDATSAEHACLALATLYQ